MMSETKPCLTLLVCMSLTRLPVCSILIHSLSSPERSKLSVEISGEILDRVIESSDRHIARSDRWICCTVSDNGEGIPPHLHSQLFDLYTRAASNKQSLSVGLGLYICRQIIIAHGGEIGVNKIVVIKEQTFGLLCP